MIDGSTWIDHRIARELRARLVEFVRRPWEKHQRWRGLMLSGDPRSGRSTLVSNSFNGDGAPEMVVAQMPAAPNAAAIWASIRDRDGTAGRHGSLGLAERRGRALDDVERTGGLLMDGGDVLADLRPERWHQALATLKAAAEERRVPFILVVSPAVAATIISDETWGERFETVHLPRRRVNRDFLDLLAAWESFLPLHERSGLADRDMALHLYSLCDGRIGRLATVLRIAAIAAIDAGTERITIPHLDNLGFSPPPSFRGFPF